MVLYLFYILSLLLNANVLFGENIFETIQNARLIYENIQTNMDEKIDMYDITFEPTMEPTSMEPITPTLMPTTNPTFSIVEQNLDFSVKFILSNFSYPSLSAENEYILLLSFEALTQINKKYINFEPDNYWNFRRLYAIQYDGYDIDETIYISMPVNSANIEDVYYHYYTLIRNSFNSGIFLDIVQEYAIQFNITDFDDIQIHLISINRYSTNDNNEHFELSIVDKIFISIGVIIFVIFVISIILKLYPRLYYKYCNYNYEDIHNKNSVVLTSDVQLQETII